MESEPFWLLGAGEEGKEGGRESEYGCVCVCVGEERGGREGRQGGSNGYSWLFNGVCKLLLLFLLEYLFHH